jgi:hypothetical protein
MPGISFVSNYGHVGVGTTPTLILASNPIRKGFLISNNNTSGTLYIGMDANVTSASGYPIIAGGGIASNDFGGVWKGAVYGIVVAGIFDIRFWEFGG